MINSIMFKNKKTNRGKEKEDRLHQRKQTNYESKLPYRQKTDIKYLFLLYLPPF